MSDEYSPTAISNRAIDAAGLDFTLGDISEGTDPARKVLRAYSDCLRQLLRTAPWNFCRKQVPLLLLADATGQTPNVGSIVPGGQFIYEYAIPTDLAFLRYIPWWPFQNPGVPPNNIQPSDPTAPIVDNLGQPPYTGYRVVPARFLVTGDVNYIPDGTSDAPNSTPGISPISRNVVLTNVQNAQCIYSFEASYPNLWGQNFRDAMIAYLASEISMPLQQDKKFGLQMRDRNIAIAIEKVRNARATEGRESWSNSDIRVDWMDFRNSGGGYYGAWGGGLGNMIGEYSCGWDSIGLSNGSAY